MHVGIALKRFAVEYRIYMVALRSPRNPELRLLQDAHPCWCSLRAKTDFAIFDPVTLTVDFSDPRA